MMLSCSKESTTVSEKMLIHPELSLSERNISVLCNMRIFHFKISVTENEVFLKRIQ